MATILFFLKKNKIEFLLIFLSSLLFFYKLDWVTLSSWDEGWYASIARNIVKTQDWFHLLWNGKPFYDHPPMGFWLMAISYLIFGVNEFSTRFPSAILGVFSIVLLYKSADLLFKNRAIGFISSIIFATSVWYVIRVRSGNLDAIFIFFYILTVYLSIKSSINFRWFPFVGLSFAALILSKTLIGVSAIVLIVFLNIRQFARIRRNIALLLTAILLFLALLLPWYVDHMKLYSDFINYHFFNIGTRSKGLSSYFHLIFDKPFFYIHMGVRKWYYLWLVSGAVLIATLSFLKRNIAFLFLWNIVVLYPFLTSERTELWHLIPVYIPLALITAVGSYELLSKILKKFLPQKLIEIIYIVGFITIAFIQIKTFYPEVFPTAKYTPDDVDISKRAERYQEKILLDDDFLPIAVYYSQKNITPLIYLPDDKKTLVKLFESDEKEFVVVTRNWAVAQLSEKKIPYKLLERNNSFSILSR